MPKFIFFGTPELAVLSLEQLASYGMVPSLIVTVPAKPMGRGLVLTPTPTEIYALKHSIPVITPRKITLEVVKEITTFGPFDYALVFAYGKIIPQTLIDALDNKVLNIHPSMLPLYRGASPLESSLLSDDTQSAITLMLIDKDVDHGPILAQEIIELNPTMTRVELEQIAASIGAKLLKETIDSFLAGTLVPQEQNHEAATFTQKIQKTDGELLPTDSDWQKWKKYRALINHPGTYFFTMRKGVNTRVKVLEADYIDNKFIIEKVIPENGKAMPYEVFLTSL